MRSDVDFDVLVRDHHAALYRFALSMTHNEADAGDLVQDAFLRWAQRGHQLVDPSKVKTWLFTTLYRDAIGRRRRQIRFVHTQIEDAESELPDVAPAAPSAADGKVVLDALSRLDDSYRAAVALFYLEDCSYPEIADILQIPLGTVKSRISRGIAQLQRLLQPAALPRPTKATS
jgi:RNA polymerase sigma-70 factor (ECF subfamily)